MKEFTLRIPLHIWDQLEIVRQRNELKNITQVLQHSLALYDYATERIQKGDTIVLKSKDGNMENEIPICTMP